LKWKENVCEEVDPSVIFVLIGSQTDRDDQRQEKYLLILITCNRQVTYEEGVEFMQENGIHFFFETSALNGTNIDLAFLEATKLGFISYLKDKKAGEGSIFHPKNENAIYLSQKNDQNEQSKCAC